MNSAPRFSDLLQDRLDRNPAAVAFVQDDNIVTVASFADLMDRSVAWLKRHNIAAGDRVAIWMVNRVEWLALLFALARIGAIAVSVNTRYRSEEVEQLLKRTRARMLVTHHQIQRIDFLEILSRIDPAALSDLENVAIVGEAAPAGYSACEWPLITFDVNQIEADIGVDGSSPDDVTILFTTSGTTRAPKLVMHPQRTIADHARRCAVAYRLDTADTCLLCMLPLCGVFGLNSTLAGFAADIPVVLQEVFEAKAAAALIVEHRVTHTFGSDEMYQRLCDVSISERPFPTARFFGFGAFTSSFSDVSRQCWRRGMPLYGMYGSSEVLALFSRQPDHLPLDQKLEGGGWPVAGTEANIRIRDTASGSLLPPGRSGEIEIKAPGNFIGYFEDPGATASAVVDGYFRTGDLGHLRPDGTFVFETRLGDAMRLGGHLVSPIEIEEILKTFDEIDDVHVVATTIAGKPRVAAFVVAAKACVPTRESIALRLLGKVADFKIPARVWLVDHFPQTEGANGNKTARVKLREIAQQKIDAEPHDAGTHS